jgi:nicotinate-nucleotide pyrophosphorylase
MDQFYKNPEGARKQIYNSLEQVQKVFRISPNTVMLLVFFEAKSDELVNIYKGASEIEKPKAIELLGEINVANLSKYEKIRGS